ncbi:MAG: hypothetical protein KAQ94_08135 [Arcobacteraceae bacterium]|nr:hypothetical protein [Arcobacteraceae bacterium]
MNITYYCPNRIKPNLLREQKTEALLVFIRTILEESFNENDILKICSNEDAKIIHNTLSKLLKELQKYVVNASYLQYVRMNTDKNKAFHILATKESPLIVYYNALSKGIVASISAESTWIPELVIIALLSEWILEEEKSIYLYPFLKDIDYTSLITIFDKARIDVRKIDIQRYNFEKDVMMNMYKVSSNLIDKLKKVKFKASSYKKSKKHR